MGDCSISTVPAFPHLSLILPINNSNPGFHPCTKNNHDNLHLNQGSARWVFTFWAARWSSPKTLRGGWCHDLPAGTFLIHDHGEWQSVQCDCSLTWCSKQSLLHREEKWEDDPLTCKQIDQSHSDKRQITFSRTWSWLFQMQIPMVYPRVLSSFIRYLHCFAVLPLHDYCVLHFNITMPLCSCDS